MKLNKREFLELKEEWYQKLKASGFEDVENSAGQLKQQDRRSHLFDNREMIQEFFTNLEHFVTNTRLPKRDRMILSLYADGEYIIDIAKRVHLHRCSVHEIIKKYKRLFVA